MKAARKRFQGLVRYVLFAVILCMVPCVAHADDFDGFIAFYAKLEHYAEEANVSLPFSSQQLDEAKDFVQCLDNAGDNNLNIAICIDEFKDTSTGSTISQKSEIPSWVWDLLDCYIYYRTQDWWSLGYKLGEAAVCIVLQVATSGTDICGILEELVDLANALWDTAKAVGQFLASVGEAAYETVKDVGCAMGIGGCDDGPDTPPEVWVYSLVFANRLGEGMAAREAFDSGGHTNPTFDNLISLLKQNALHKPEPILSVPAPPDLMGMRDAIYSQFTPGAVNKAADIYILNVNIQWTNDIAPNVLQARAKKISDAASPPNLDSLTKLVLSAYTPHVPWNPSQIIINKCTNDFKLEYAHVDRWLTIFPISLRGPQAEAIAPTVKSNYELSQAFYDQVKNEIYQRIRAHVIQHYAPNIGGRLVGNTIDKHRSCLELMKPFGQETQCWANTAACGKEARDAILKEFKNKGTQFYDGFSYAPPPLVSAIPTYDPMEFLCYRPNHEYYFNIYYDKFYKDLPRKLLKSKLQMDGAYKSLKDKVAAEVDKLNGDYEYTAYGVDDVDPLMVATADFQALDDVQQSANNFGFGPPKPGFEFFQGPRNITIDGRSTPLMYFDLMGSARKPLIKMKAPLNREDLAVLDPSDPITNPVYRPEAVGRDVMQTPNQLRALSPGFKAAPQEVAADGATQPMSGSLPGGKTLATGLGTIQSSTQMNKVITGINSPPVEVATDGAAQPLSGSLPTGTTSQAGPEIKQTPTPMMARPGLPDMMAEPQISLNQIRTRWRKSLELISETPILKVDIEFTVKNSGKGASTGFMVNCVSAGSMLFQKSLNPLGVGGATRVNESVNLAPGNHVLVVTIDSANAVMESNEGNNRYEIRLNVRPNPGMNIQRRISPLPAPESTIPARN